MKRLLVIAASFSLLLPALSVAQPGGPPGHRPERPGSGPPGRPPPGPGPGMRPPQHRPPAVRPPQRPPQFSWRGQYYNRYHGPAFRYPPGYAYRRWTAGALLPTLFLSSLYYFDDWRLMGISPPPRGYRWVRYGPDLLLVDVRTRRVRDVIYGAFY